MKVLTLNTWQESGPWQERWEVIFEGLKRLGPDVIAFQEVFNAAWAEKIKTRTGMPFLVFPSEPGGLMFLSRFPVEESGGLTMKTQAPSESYLRYGLFARLKVRSRSLAVFNTHLSWQVHESEVRSRQVKELLNFINLKGAGCEALVMGDFNATPETPEIRLMKEGEFSDAFGELYPGQAGLTWNNRNTFTATHKLPDRRIDYIFYKKSADFEPSASENKPVATESRARVLSKLKDAELVLTKPGAAGVYASDHYGVLATFQGKRT